MRKDILNYIDSDFKNLPVYKRQVNDVIIGLTGGIASGKSTVSKYLKEKGYQIFDADKIAKDLTNEDNIKNKIVEKFGSNILDNNFSLDRKKMKEIVFNDKSKLKLLNDIIHPEVFEFYKKAKENNKENKILIFDVPLLFESGIDSLCDKILVVISDHKIQIERIIERDKIDKTLATNIINSQITDKERIKKADIVIENNGSLEELYEKIERVCESI